RRMCDERRQMSHKPMDTNPKPTDGNPWDGLPGDGGATIMNLREPGSVLLISCYELGHQPLGVASPFGFLKRAGFAPDVLDIAVDPFDEAQVARARFVAISVP